MKHIRRFLIVVAILAIAPVLAQAQRVDLIHLDPEPHVGGGCPAHVHFHGRIRTTGPLEVTYQWLRSDGGRSEYTLYFERAETRSVSTEWVLSRNFSGWMELVILSPRRMQTTRAFFSVHSCR